MEQTQQVEKPRPKSKLVFFTLIGMSTAILLVTPVIVLLFVGLFLDNLFKTTPWIMIIGIGAGFIGGIMNVMRLMKTIK